MKVSKFVKAKEIIKQTFKDDPGFRRTYVDNIACYLMDRIPEMKLDKDRRDFISSEILRIVCE